MRQELHEVKTQVERLEARLGERLTRENGITRAMIRRIAIQPAQPVRNDNNEPVVHANAGHNNMATVNAQINVASLSPTPRDLHVLWQEYEFAVGGRKPAKLFTASERGRVKYTYHRRKVVWDTVAELIRRGHTAQTAIDLILQTYGENTTTTKIINQMRRDRPNGGHPALRA